MRILIGADIVPTERNIDSFVSGDVKSLIGDDLQSIINQADFRIFNLEVPLTNIKSPIAKCGDALLAPTLCIAGLKAMNIDLFTLSNNHIMDQDVQGLQSTIKTLDDAKIAYVGAGFSKEEAAKSFYFQCNGKIIGVYACAEHEFSIVGNNTPGANPIDLLDSFDHIRETKKESDYVIVLYHGGKEFYRYPSPNLQKVCHKLIDVGADLVICQHSHCIGAEEKYKHGTIVYGQGNFIFDGSDDEYWQTSLLIQICDGFEIKYIPLIKKCDGVRLADKSRSEEILSEYYMRSQEIKDSANVQKRYNELAEQYITEFLSVAAGRRYNIIVRGLNKIMGNNKLIQRYIDKKYSMNKRLTLLNRIECEAYNELFISGLKRKNDMQDKNTNS